MGAGWRPVTNLSDGEKQVLLVSLLLTTEHNAAGIILVDKPELHLNDARAIDVWEQIERKFPQTTFVYATHSLSFATRPNVGRLYLVRPQGRLERLDDDQAPSSAVPRHAVDMLVGGRIQVSRSDKPIIFCEDALAKAILQDLFGASVEVVARGDCEAVIAAVKGHDGWGIAFSTGRGHCGVIDRDNRCDDDLARLPDGVFAFPFFESESLLMTPEIASLYLPSGIAARYDEILLQAAKAAYISALQKMADEMPVRFNQARGRSDQRIAAPDPSYCVRPGIGGTVSVQPRAAKRKTGGLQGGNRCRLGRE